NTQILFCREYNDDHDLQAVKKILCSVRQIRQGFNGIGNDGEEDQSLYHMVECPALPRIRIFDHSLELSPAE
ncbi:MAG: hypothetical protein OXC69_02590, partial [Candidatus Tectomicrobia bacterium]|nr:hypothetical protein [Candidatus Tectomicrobia bacterium]